ncbi:MAG: CotH kinase family protein, partial [Bacillota bacterium]
VDLIFFQGSTGGEVEFYAAPGAKTSFDSSFKLVGDSAHGGLSLVSLQDSIGTNIQTGMLNVNASAYVRVPFPAVDPASLDRLVLRMKYDDGFVAYLNGHPIAQSDNILSAPAWNSKADFAGSDIDALTYESFDITNLKDYLSASGTNVLAIQVLNAAADDPDLLVIPELTGTLRAAPDETRYFVAPTPWGPNNTGVEDLGPIITNLGHTPAVPNDADDVVVTATVNQALSPVGLVEMHYRVTYGAEKTVLMYDDGLHGDGAAGDHVYGATIPASVSKSGQMVRYYVTASDDGGRQSRWPMIPQSDPEPWSTRKWPEYQGFVVSDPTLVTSLPTIYWFAANYSAAESRSGTRCSVYYNGEFYDNVFVRVRGGYATGGQKFDFNKGYSFSYDPNLERVSEINLNRQGGIAVDDAWIRPVIAFETYRDAGCPTCIALPVRLQKGTGAAGGEIRIFIEQPDDEYLKRQGLYDNGALYKAVNSDNAGMDPWGFSKKTRETEGYDDLQELINGLKQADPNARAKFVLDNVDIATFLNYQVATILVEEMDSVQKNYYLYRDTQDADNPNGTNKWMMLPWDKHLTFGKNWGISDYQARDPQAHPFFGDRKHPKIDGSFAWNLMIEAVLSVPVVKQMYLRRLRTLMDQLLQPASTPYADRYYETRLDALYNELIGDPKFKSTASAVKRAFDDIKTKYLAVRRQHLYVDHSENTAYRDYAGIPAAQVGSPTITFGDIEFNPASGNQNEEYIELRNPNDVAVDISAWRIEGGIDYEIKPGVVIPAKGSIYLSPNLVAFKNRTTGPRGGQGLLVFGPYPGQLSARGETLTLKDGAGNVISSTDSEGNPTPAQQFLRITEIMYNPPDASGSHAPDNEEFEYIELQNISTTQSLNLNGIGFAEGVDFTFGDVTLQPGQYVLVVKNRSAFESRYGTGLPIAGEYPTKYLGNSSDRIHLVDAAGESILDFSYEDSWHTSTDHDGRSLVIVDPAASPSAWDSANGWRPSAFNNGSPGQADPQASQGSPTVRIMPVQPEQRYTPVDAISIVFSEPIAGFSVSSLKLTCDGISLPLGNGPTLNTADNITWVLRGLTGLTKAGGDYKLTINGSSIIDREGHPLAASDSEKFTIGTSPLAASIGAVTPNPRNISAGPFTITFNRPVVHFGISDLRLTRGDSGNLLTGFERLVTEDHTTWQLFGVSALTGSTGTYTLAIDPAAANITDKDGFALMTGDQTTFTVDVTLPTASVVPGTPDPKTGVIDTATITFSEPIAGFDMADIQLLRGSDPVSLGAAPTLTTTDNITWTLSGFSIVLSQLGTYQLLIRTAGSGIIDQSGNPLAADARASFVNSVIWGDCSESDQNILLVAHATDPATLDVYMNFMTMPAYTIPLTDLRQITIITGDANDTVSLSGPVSIPVRFLGGRGTNVLRLDLGGGSYTFERDLAEDTANLTLSIQNSLVTFAASQRLAALNLSGGANAVLATNAHATLVAGS